MNIDRQTIICPHCKNEIKLDIDVEISDVSVYDITPKKNIKDLTNPEIFDYCPDCKLLKINCTCIGKKIQEMLI